MSDCIGASGEPKNQHGEEELVSVRWIAGQTGLSRVTIRRHLDRAGIKPIRFGKSRNATLRYRRLDIEAWMRSCWLG